MFGSWLLLTLKKSWSDIVETCADTKKTSVLVQGLGKSLDCFAMAYKLKRTYIADVTDWKI